MDNDTYDALTNKSFNWLCPHCEITCFTNSYFSSSEGETTDNDDDTEDYDNDNKSGDDDITDSTKNKRKPASKKSLRKEMLFTTLNINFQSIMNKRAEWEAMIHELQPDFIHGTETWLDSSIENAECLPDGYALHRRDRSSGTDRHGGVFFAYRKDLPVNRRQDLETNSEMLWCQLNIQGRRPILFGTLYKPKHDDIETVEDLAVMLETINNHSKLKDVVIQGDLNQPNIDWVNKKVIVNHPASKITAERLLQTVQEHGLDQVVDKPTRLNSILDLVLTNNSSFIKNVEVIPCLSDHEAVLSVLNGFAQVKKKPPHKIYLKHKADVEKIKQDMKIFGDEVNLTVQEKWDMFDSKIKQVMDENVPTKMSSNRRNLPWFTRTHIRMCKKKGRMYSKAKRTGDQKDWEEYKEFCRTIKKRVEPRQKRVRGG
ncbi:uncharacterized protein [Amphiura filiformis]|uniref:uncharacterized protein n=1 Tax=Amphiura filiformis TaxID=82378 RepID=UPI003B21A090